MVNIKVAVRIRPMSEREHGQRDVGIVGNSEKCILVTNPKMPEKSDGADSRQRVRRFAVDYCYDPTYPDLATQEAVFEEVGTEVLGHMFDGYNACVLAYGHSASGKTYTMMGTQQDPGLTPRICSNLCRTMKKRTELEYLVSISFLEIYNEKVRDLLVDEYSNQGSAFCLRVREHPKLGPYVQDLSEHVIEDEQDLLALLNLGNIRRSTAATESNSQSSRSHAVFTIRFKQVGENAAKSSKVHLVDLAGSERASSIQSRARLKEGANINKSLVTLGNVISALAESCETPWGKVWTPFVPYRDSVLTWLLKDTLGGNSNTIMIATISPASSCYSETINTLRYAKRTKRIINQPMINEDPKVRTIRELRDEVSRLKTMLLSFTSVGLQTEDMEYQPLRLTAGGQSMGAPFTNDLLEHLAVIPSSPGRTSPSFEEGVRHNLTTLDILPANKTKSCVSAPHVSEINAENGPGVNRVIADPARLWESNREKAASSGSGVVPRVGRPPFKRRRAPLRRGLPYWSMLHRSRPDLIKGIGSRAPETPSTSGQGLAEALSQSTSDVSVHSSGSTEFQPRLQAAASLSRTSSVGDASGSSTPTLFSRPSVRKKENKRAEIVASVTSRLYAIKKKPDKRQEAILAAEKEDEEDDELEEMKLCKRARMKLFDLSRKLAMAKKVKRTVDSDTQTELQSRTLRVKDKGVATEQQGVLRVQSCATNTPVDPELTEQESPVVMNQVYLQGTGTSFIFECGPNLRVEIPRPQQNDSGSQTLPQYRDQTTSPKKSLSEIAPFDDLYSDDSLESESSVNLHSSFSLGRKNLATKFYSCQELNSRIVPLYHNVEPRFYSQPNILPLKNIHEKRIHQIKSHSFGVNVEKNLEPIARYGICGTNAIYEYDPNKAMPEKVIFTNLGDSPSYGPGTIPSVVYPQYQPELFNGLPMSSSDGLTSSDDAINHSKSQHNESAEDNLSSGTSSASTGSSIGASDTSSDDFVFMESVVPQVIQARELYTISENSEPSCSSRSSPLNSRSPRLDAVDEAERENEDDKIKENIENPVLEGTENDSVNSDNVRSSQKLEKRETKKKTVNWAEMECSGKNQFVNFNYTPSPMIELKRKDQSTEALFPSQDSITFVFVGAKQKETSVLMEVVKRSLLGGSDPADIPNQIRSRSKTDQSCSGKLMRSVSVDTAMIALSRLARNQGPSSDISRTASMTNVASAQIQVVVDTEALGESSDTGTQCKLVEMMNASSEIHPIDNSSQCNLERSATYSMGTNTTTDRETETNAELRETTTQTDLEELFDNTEIPELPRRTISPAPEDFNNRWKEIKQLVLGTGKDLFPDYLLSDNNERQKHKNPKLPRKTVSWSDLSGIVEGTLGENRRSGEGSSETPNTQQIVQTRRVRFSEPSEENQHQASTFPRRRVPTTEKIKEFLIEATTLLQSLHHSDSENTVPIVSPKRKYSTSSLLRRRRKLLSQIKINRNSPTITLNESSVQTDTETINRFVQTGGFASSLVGPPIRSLTPNLRREPHEDLDTLNSTWPRRRISAKPPTGLKANASPRCSTPVRPSCSSSRLSMGSTDPSPISSMQNSPIHSRSPGRGPNNLTDQNANLQIEKSFRRLEIAIEQDRARQSNLADCLDFYFKGNPTEPSMSRPATADRYSSVINIGRNDLRSYDQHPTELGLNCPAYDRVRNNFEPDRFAYKMNDLGTADITSKQTSEEIFESSKSKHSTNISVGWSVTDDFINRRQHNDFRSTRETQHSRTKYYSNGLYPNKEFRELPSVPLNIGPSTPRAISPREISQKYCSCTCHNFNFSCGDVNISVSGNRHCHTCCVPCSSDTQRPYSSEPSLTPSPCDCRPSSRMRGSPMAHLRHLIALRRSIVAAQKTNN